MSATVTVTALPSTVVEPASLHLIAGDTKKEEYPALQPFEHVDAGSRALHHPNPRSFLANSNVVEMTPEFGLDVRGCNLAELNPDQKDQLALEVARRGVVVFREQQDFIDRGAGFYTEWARHFGPLHVHPTSGHPEGHHEVHLVYKDAKSKFKTDSITSTLWHSDCSFELQPAGLTTFFLLAQPKTGGDTLYSSQVLNFRSLSPIMQDFFAHAQSDAHGHWQFALEAGWYALYVNKQFTRRIVGMKVEESELLLNFLYDHIAKSNDHQVRIKWEPMTMVLWDNRITAHTATYDYSHMKVLRHGARISAQAERPIPALSTMKMED
ncbi:TauD-domain-containing protein [Mycena venus]|uniref:TauD-domain-containing protein n=1 Tax=Mycena venus TaxID=2733690 RepID=A0A8H7D2V4_9AGAR|nr:TauD-domain-containing protein [Mycena venus]